MWAGSDSSDRDSRRLRHRLSRPVAVVLGMSALAAPALAAAATTVAVPGTSDVVVTIAGIDRNGAPAPVLDGGVLFGHAPDGNGRFTVSPGTYLAGGYVETPSPSGHTGFAIVVRSVDITRSGKITLDARGSLPFTVALTGVAAKQQTQAGVVCVKSRAGTRTDYLPFLEEAMQARSSGGGEVAWYVKPRTAQKLKFLYYGGFSGPAGGLRGDRLQGRLAIVGGFQRSRLDHGSGDGRPHERAPALVPRQRWP